MTQEYEYCFINGTKCANVKDLKDIYLYFNATSDIERNYTQYFMSFSKDNYAKDAVMNEPDGSKHEICKLEIFG